MASIMHINVYKLILKEASNHSSFDKDIFEVINLIAKY